MIILSFAFCIILFLLNGTVHSDLRQLGGIPRINHLAGFCGAFALQEVMRSHGEEIDVYDIMSSNEDESETPSLSMLSLKEVAQSRSLGCTVVRTNEATIPHWPNPIIASVKASSKHPDGHFVVIYPNKTAFCVWDPISAAKGKERDLTALVPSELAGEFLLCTKDKPIDVASIVSSPVTDSIGFKWIVTLFFTYGCIWLCLRTIKVMCGNFIESKSNTGGFNK